MITVHNPLTDFYSVHSLYVCDTCDKYHLCSGSMNCVPVVDKEGLVCEITGKCIQSNVKDIETVVLDEPTNKYVQFMESEFILQSIYSDIVEIINKLDDISEIIPEIVINNELNLPIKKNIASTLHLCMYIIHAGSTGYSTVCSMYVHIIMSIYAKKTIYGHMLFKCTRNKKYDATAKKIREKWMCTI